VPAHAFTENSPYFAYLLGLVFMAAGGRDLLLVRLVGIAADSLTAVFVARLAGRRFGPVAGATAGLLYAAYGPAIFFATELIYIPYALLLCTMTVLCLTSERLDARRMLAAGEADAVLWVAALDAEAPPATAAPLIALAADEVALPAPAAVELRVGIPGIDHGGAIFRADGVVALKLSAARPSTRPSVAEAAGAILAAMGPLPC
jgi:hypothetical protein